MHTSYIIALVTADAGSQQELSKREVVYVDSSFLRRYMPI
jgi:hypothetical protein